MNYSFTPLTDDELDAIDLIPQGVYDFEVIKSTRRTSKAGNPMAELQLNVWDNEGKQHIVFDYLVFSNINLYIRKLSHFCKATGLEAEYKRGLIPEILEKYSGKVEIGIQDEQPKSTGGFYPKKNIVLDYVKRDAEASTTKPKEEEFVDSDIPF